jgi:two-component system, NtrC family, response regulator AtoC
MGSRGLTPKTRKLTGPADLRFLQQSPVSLLIYHRDGAQLAQLRPDSRLIIGRDAPSDVCIHDVSLSRQHAQFSLEGGELTVEDLGSTNGTFIAGQNVEKAVVKPGDEVVLGTVTVTVHEPNKSAPATGLIGHDRFRETLAYEVTRSRFFGRPLSVIIARALDGSDRHVRYWFPRIQPIVRPVDWAAMYGPEVVELLLPDASLAVALELAEKMSRAEPRVGFGVATFPEAGTSAEELLGESRAAAQRSSRAHPVQTAEAQGPRTVAPEKDSDMVAQSAAMKELLHTARRVAKGSIPVLIHGETGTGKEVLSRFIHETSTRKKNPIICVNCGAIPGELVESMLFGHEKGAFTGAAQQQKGVFEAADGGTVFLDEIGELPATAQAALLRVLETKRFTRVGSTKEIAVDVRMLAATHRDLQVMCDEGGFRLDLFFRLNTMTLRVPPLRERIEDIEPLSQRLLERANEANGAHIRRIDRDALDLMRAYEWPGNVRELKNVIERAVVIAEGDEITADDLPETVRGRRSERMPAANGGEPAGEPRAGTPFHLLEGDFRTRLERLEADLLRDALEHAGWNQTETARQLSMPLRTLTYKIKVLGIKKPPAPPRAERRRRTPPS